jgi:hypothetical protein
LKEKKIYFALYGELAVAEPMVLPQDKANTKNRFTGPACMSEFEERCNYP